MADSTPTTQPWRSNIGAWLSPSNIAIAGLLVFVIVAAPAAIFYSRFGVVLGEVGVSYTGILTTSFIGLAIYVAVAVIAAVTFVLIWVPQAAAISQVAGMLKGRPRIDKRPVWEWTDADYEEYLNWMRRLWNGSSYLSGLAPVELVLAHRAGVRTAAVREFRESGVDAARKYMADHPLPVKLDPWRFFVEYYVGSHFRRLWRSGMLITSFSILFVAFPVLAWVEAGNVSSGVIHPWVQSGVLGFQAQRVASVRRVDGKDLISDLGPGDKILLGHTSDEVILLDVSSGGVQRLSGGTWIIFTEP